MAIDTIKLKAYVSEDIYKKLTDFCIIRQAIDMQTQECIYQITTGSLSGTYDSRISMKVDRDYEPYVIFEFSLHKLLMGHNVYGGTDDLQAGVAYFHDFIQNFIGLKWGFCYKKWRLMRIDLAEIYTLESFDIVQEWFKGLNACDYPKRTVQRYGLESICAYGQTTGLKCYHKGPEFWKHDRKKLQRLGYDTFELQELANRILRLEVEIKSKKLKKMHLGEYPYIGQVKYDHLLNVYDVEVKRFLKEGVNDMKTVRNNSDVMVRLYDMFSDSLASQLYATWLKLSANGEDTVKKSMKKPTYYRHIKKLKEAGISWHGTDVVVKPTSIVPQDFVPVRTDPRRIVGEAPEVQEKLHPFRIAVAC